MKKGFKLLTLLGAITLVGAIASCGGNGEAPSGSGSKDDVIDQGSGSGSNGSTSTETNDGKIEYSVNVLATNKKPVEGIYVELYHNNKRIDSNFTGNDGKVVFREKPNEYDIKIGDTDGYIPNKYSAKTDLLGTPIEITCKPEIVEGERKLDNIYTDGDVMYDFTLTDVDKNTYNLKDLIENQGKKAVILNFWLSSCGPCVGEFPYVNEAYNETFKKPEGSDKYTSDIAFLAVNPTNTSMGGAPVDTPERIKEFKTKNKLSFDMVPDYNAGNSAEEFIPGLSTLFNVRAFPKTVVIDRYGYIAEIEEGAIPDTIKWKSLFNKYCDPDYTPVWKGGLDNNEEDLHPDIEMPESSVIENIINGTNYDGNKFNASYVNEDEDAKMEYSWPFVVSDDNKSIHPSNIGKDSSFATLKFDIALKKGEVFTFDYFSSCEYGSDNLYIVIDGIIVTQISGKSAEGKGYETCFAYPAAKDATFTIRLIYSKDDSASDGDDTVYINNFRVLKTDDINKKTYIYREAADGELNKFTGRYAHYITPVFNEKDGYWHVESVDGPLLLLDVLSGSHWNPTKSLYEMTVDKPEEFLIENVDYTNIVGDFAVLANDGTVPYAPITAELGEALKTIVKALGGATSDNNPNQWLELCVYYDAYATPQLESPIKGLAPFEALELDMVNRKGVSNIDRILTSQGYIFKFVPEKSGVYKFYSLGENETAFTIYNDKNEAIGENENLLRDFFKPLGENEKADLNFISYFYYEANKTYYIQPRFTERYETGTINFEWDYLGESYNILTKAALPTFTTNENFEAGSLEDSLIAGGVDIEYNEEDKLFHVIGASRNPENDLLYFDAEYAINVFGGRTFEELLHPMIDGKPVLDKDGNPIPGAFDFTFDENGTKCVDKEGYLLKKKMEPAKDPISGEIIKNEDGSISYIESMVDGKFVYDTVRQERKDGTQIKLKDMTDRVEAIINQRKITEGEFKGLVVVDKELADILRNLMDKYTFFDVENSFKKLCYYSKHIGAKA